MLEINNLRVDYGNTTALLIDRPIVINKGERVGIIGSNGAGKSTLVKAILGITKYSGRINCNIKPEEMAVHMQENNYVDTMKIEYIIEGILGEKVSKNKKLQELIDFFDFKNCLNKKFKNLSGGQKQRMTIILVLMQDAPLVFFDEVTSGLDFETRQQLMEKIVSWFKNKETTICIVSHYYEELEQIVDKLLIIEKGRVIDYGNKDELFRKYCGNSIIIVDNNEFNKNILKGFNTILSPGT
ncbi:MAG: ABC transporter ATP-binding protein [Clostridiaceae bacterium]|nr:ABC transporter ATP-binding protein [Clostridiaceae bacterium]